MSEFCIELSISDTRKEATNGSVCTQSGKQNCPMIEKLETEGCSKDACIIAIYIYTHVKTFIQLENTICSN